MNLLLVVYWFELGWFGGIIGGGTGGGWFGFCTCWLDGGVFCLWSERIFKCAGGAFDAPAGGND